MSEYKLKTNLFIIFHTGTAHMILQNMNGSVDPCDDFYKVS